ncbi:SLATT domain-containing protein [Parasphingorhabdus sp.]|uniref:SLATT domain-containing protein n=1 Tax=Parasphingorhabdus sp. TaxID=2709688 RepID=UPI003265F85D
MAHLVLSYYSASLIVFSVFAIASRNTTQDFIIFMMSVAIFAASVIIYGFDFSKKAGLFRSCYLELDKLHNREIGDKEKYRIYGEILDKYPNHSDGDYVSMVIGSERVGRTLTNSAGEKIAISRRRIVEFYSQKVLEIALIVLMTVLPIYLLATVFWKTWN